MFFKLSNKYHIDIVFSALSYNMRMLPKGIGAEDMPV